MREIFGVGVLLFIVGSLGVLFLAGVMLVATWKGVREYLSQRSDAKRRRHKHRRKTRPKGVSAPGRRF